MTSVVSLRGGPIGAQQVDPECVKALEDALTAARSGYLNAVVVSAVSFDGKAVQYDAGLIHSPAMLGSVALTQRNLLDEMSSEVVERADP